MLLTITGSLSTSHWMLAALVGMSKPLGILLIYLLLQGYLAIVVATILLALLTVLPMRRILTDSRAAQGTFRAAGYDHPAGNAGDRTVALCRRAPSRRDRQWDDHARRIVARQVADQKIASRRQLHFQLRGRIGLHLFSFADDLDLFFEDAPRVVVIR